MYKIYWTDNNNQAQSQHSSELVQALTLTEAMRKAGNTFVTMVSENPNSVGKPGVDSIADGKCPNGEMYGWSKRRQLA